jgi:hypothetical protein
VFSAFSGAKTVGVENPVVSCLPPQEQSCEFFAEAQVLDEIQTKVLRVFLLAIQSQLYSFALRFYFFKLRQPLTVSALHCKGERRKT